MHGCLVRSFYCTKNVGLSGETFGVSKDELQVQDFMELVEPTGAKVLAFYDHYMWKEYAAVTKKQLGQRYLLLYRLQDKQCIHKEIDCQHCKRGRTLGLEAGNCISSYHKRGCKSGGEKDSLFV